MEYMFCAWVNLEDFPCIYGDIFSLYPQRLCPFEDYVYLVGLQVGVVNMVIGIPVAACCLLVRVTHICQIHSRRIEPSFPDAKQPTIPVCSLINGYTASPAPMNATFITLPGLRKICRQMSQDLFIVHGRDSNDKMLDTPLAFDDCMWDIRFDLKKFAGFQGDCLIVYQ